MSVYVELRLISKCVLIMLMFIIHESLIHKTYHIDDGAILGQDYVTTWGGYHLHHALITSLPN